MTKEEYIKQLDNRVGLCEMCCYFKQCAKEGSLKIKGCDKHPNYKKEE